MPEDTTSDLTSEVTHTGTAKAAPSYAIAPEDQHLADALMAMDPVNDVPTPHSIPDGWAANTPLRVTMLPPAMQSEVRARLMALPEPQRAANEAAFTAEAIKAIRADIRIKTGVGQGPRHSTAR